MARPTDFPALSPKTDPPSVEYASEKTANPTAQPIPPKAPPALVSPEPTFTATSGNRIGRDDCLEDEVVREVAAEQRITNLFELPSRTKNLFSDSDEPSTSISQPIFAAKSNKKRTRMKSKVLKDWTQICQLGNDRYYTCLMNQQGCDVIATGRPSVSSGESLLEGTMHLAFLQDDSIQMSCHDIRDLENTVLTFLADNIGSQDTYHPACVSIVDHAYDRQVIPDSGGKTVESRAFEVDVIFIQQEFARRKLRTDNGFNQLAPHGRKLAFCTSTERALCCSQNAINNNVGRYCSSLDCNMARCGRGRRPRRVTRHLRVVREQLQKPRMILSRRAKSSKTGYHLFAKAGSKSGQYILAKSGKSSSGKSSKRSSMQARTICPWYGLFSEEAFQEVVRSNTAFEPEATYALLNVSDTGSVAACSANRYSVVNLGTPTLTCEDFESENCDDNEDLPADRQSRSMKYQKYSSSSRSEEMDRRKPTNSARAMSTFIAGLIVSVPLWLE